MSEEGTRTHSRTEDRYMEELEEEKERKKEEDRTHRVGTSSLVKQAVRALFPTVLALSSSYLHYIVPALIRRHVEMVRESRQRVRSMQ
jgi:hypothetical protein